MAFLSSKGTWLPHAFDRESDSGESGGSSLIETPDNEKEEEEEIGAGDMVETTVFVGEKRISVGSGRVERVYSGYCDVDHCYPYAVPWIYGETISSLRKIHEEKR